MTARIVVLISGEGTNLQSLLDRGEELGGTITRVISDRPDVGGLKRADRANIATGIVAFENYPDRQTWQKALEDKVAAEEPDLVVLAGFMRILPTSFVSRWPVLNVHPSLLPAFPGAHAVEEALAWGVMVTGCTVHFVDEEVDHGPVVAQVAVVVRPGDTPETLHERIKKVEHRLLPDCVTLFCQGQITVEGRHVRISQ